MVNEKPLYKTENFKVEYNPHSHEDHILYIKNEPFHIPRGVLDELSRTKEISQIERKLNAMNDRIVYFLKENQLDVSDLALVFTQAKIFELEEEVSYFISEARNIKENN